MQNQARAGSQSCMVNMGGIQAVPPKAAQVGEGQDQQRHGIAHPPSKSKQSEVKQKAMPKRSVARPNNAPCGVRLLPKVPPPPPPPPQRAPRQNDVADPAPLAQQDEAPDGRQQREEQAEAQKFEQGTTFKMKTKFMGGSESLTFSLMIEPCLSMMQRDVQSYTCDGEQMSIVIGRPTPSFIVCFPEPRQFFEMVIPHSRVAKDTGCVVLDGFLTSWEFALLEMKEARSQLKLLLRQAMDMVRRQSVLAHYVVAVFGTYRTSKSIKVYGFPHGGATAQQIAVEFAQIFNQCIDSTLRENGLHLVRCYMLDGGDAQDPFLYPREQQDYTYQSNPTIRE
eukprot:3258077-Amphidinium_carterae.1